MDSFNVVWDYIFGIPKPPINSTEAQTSMDEGGANTFPKFDNNLRPKDQDQDTAGEDKKFVSSANKSDDRCKPFKWKWSKCGNDTKGAENQNNISKHSDKGKLASEEKRKNKCSKGKHKSDENANDVISPTLNSTSVGKREGKVDSSVQTEVIETRDHNVNKRSEHESKRKEPKTRTCGDLKVERMDLNFPNIDQSELEPVKSNVAECYKLKTEYDMCFQNWFAYNFLHGSESMEPCQDLLKKYSACVKNGLQFAVYQPGCYHSTDPDDHRVEKPRKRPPSGAQYYQG